MSPSFNRVDICDAGTAITTSVSYDCLVSHTRNIPKCADIGYQITKQVLHTTR